MRKHLGSLAVRRHLSVFEKRIFNDYQEVWIPRNHVKASKICTHPPPTYTNTLDGQFSEADPMGQGQLDAVVRHIRRLAGASAGESTDAQLLQQFVAQRDGEAFATLVRRHGGLIRAVCRHILHREEDVEDALQATLLVLARRAASIRKANRSEERRVGKECRSRWSP